MEGVYEKLIGNSGKLSALGHLICSFSNCFQKSSGSRSFFVVATGGGLKKKLTLYLSKSCPGCRCPWCPRPRGTGAVRGAERALRPAQPGNRASPGPACGAVVTRGVLHSCSALPASFLQRKTSPGCQKAGLAAECYLKFSKCAHQQQWSYRWGEVEMKAVTRVMEIISHGDLNTEYRIILPWIRSWLPEI